MKGVYDISDFGATGDGQTDDSSAIQAAIDMAKKYHGGVVWFPPGNYRLGMGIVIEEFVTLVGVGWSNNPHVGTWIYVDDTEIKPFSIKAGGVVMRDIGIFHKQPNPSLDWKPLEYEFAISIQADDVKLQNICLFNPTLGILLDRPGMSTGRIVLDGIYGQPLAQGIRIDNANDIIRINNVHFWPYWSNDDIVRNYTHGVAEGITSYRNDNPFFSNIFIFGYNKGMHFSINSNGSTNKFHIANADIDICHTALLIDGNSTSGQLVNFTSQGREEFETAIHVDANDVTVQCSNIRLQTYGNNCIRVNGLRTSLYFENLWCGDWNRSGNGFPAIEARNGANIKIGKASLDFDPGLRGKEQFGEVGGNIELDL
ncbi:hypothetical protein C6W22_02185 [Bacillus atrophaeus]|uniref:glycosyl hydrolase family 28-related protein n=1 Tax=Bacillus atrophaeus TaxID=1452 RepID=UPI0007C52ACC|nr:glycosyl hydrolase family 28-related protein [Bacillus atrophaeus]MDS9997438.1 glycoside hydrolase family 55 protein [Bacillus atrophaeus]PRS09659.1 hypothetical protein C6W22_02185 [Bacillus atrophaeus]WFE15908.1 glycosyl hydrolase family 28-related protein [Bacillus atrophaeus]